MMDYEKTKNYRMKKKLLIANVVAFVSLDNTHLLNQVKID